MFLLLPQQTLFAAQFSQVQADDKVLFFLEDSAGDETLVATGHESADGEFTFVGNIAEPFVTRSKQKLLEWIQQITVRLNMPTEARPNKMMAQNDIPASPGQSSPLTLSPETSHPSHPEDNANNSSGDAESNGGGASMDHDAQPSGSGEIDAKAGTAMAEDGPSGEPGSSGLSEQKFAFVSYREEVRGFSDPFQGEVPRRMKHWLLKDSRGREHTAVNTIKWEPKKKRFTYEAVAPFSDVRPLRCHNQRLVLEYLDQFVPPKARQADTLPDRSPAVPNGPPKPATAKNGAGSKDKSTSHGGPLSPKSHQAAKPKAHSAGKSSMTSELRLAAAKHELDMLHSQFGMQYSLTLISPNQQVKVLTSASVVSTGGQAVGLSSLRFDDCEVHRDGQTGGSQELAELGALDLLTAMATAGRDDADAKKGKKGSKRRSGDAERAEAKRAKQEPEDPLVASVMAAMESNTKMYMPGTWRREPFQSHPLTQEIDDFLLAEDCGEALDREMLSQKLSVRLPCTGGGGPGSPAPSPGPNDVMIVLDSLPKPVRSTEVDLQPVWGLDSYTRSLLASALESCTATPDQAARDAFIQKELLPTLNSLGEDGWDLFKALKAVEKRSTSPEARLAAQHTLHVLTELEKHTNDGKDCPPNGREWSRVHCKGTGVVLKRKAGLPAGTFVGEYLGELCTAWRWAEREGKGTRGGVGTGASASKGRNAWRMGASPDFYNIALERPKADTRGYDVLYVDVSSSLRGSILHSLWD